MLDNLLSNMHCIINKRPELDKWTNPGGMVELELFWFCLNQNCFTQNSSDLYKDEATKCLKTAENQSKNVILDHRTNHKSKKKKKNF